METHEKILYVRKQCFVGVRNCVSELYQHEKSFLQPMKNVKPLSMNRLSNLSSPLIYYNTYNLILPIS